MQNEKECCRGQEAQNQVDGVGCCYSESADDQCLNNNHQTMDASNSEESLRKLQELLSAANDKYVRLYSEFENFKKRTAKERMTLIDSANGKTLKELLPIIDDFERGMTAWQEEVYHDTQNAMQAGMKLIHDKLVSFLKKFGVKEMTLEQGSEFNADFHEAIMHKLVENPEMQGKIITVTEKGYLINGCVLRFAKVVIGL
jgi:molecular chaperone GrpE